MHLTKLKCMGPMVHNHSPVPTNMILRVLLFGKMQKVFTWAKRN